MHSEYPNKPTGVGLAKYFLSAAGSPAGGGGGPCLLFASIYHQSCNQQDNLLIQLYRDSDGISTRERRRLGHATFLTGGPVLKFIDTGKLWRRHLC
jgi:hypothetical protein